MNKDILSGKWKQLKGTIKQRWGELTDDEIDRIAGNWERLAGTIQERYGYERAEAENQVNQFIEQAEKEISKISP